MRICAGLDEGYEHFVVDGVRGGAAFDGDVEEHRLELDLLRLAQLEALWGLKVPVADRCAVRQFGGVFEIQPVH